MAKTIDASGVPKQVFQYVLVGSFTFGILFFAALFCWTVLGTFEVAIPFADGLVWAVVFAVLWAGLTGGLVRHLRRGDGDWWVPIPREYSLGRSAFGGGLSRHSWERALDRLPDGESEDRER